MQTRRSVWLILGILLSAILVLLQWVLLSSGALAQRPSATTASNVGRPRPGNQPVILADEPITYSNLVYLPLVLKYTPPPDAPSLADISNGDCDGYYTVDWTEAPRAEAYSLEEKPYQDWPPDFSWGWDWSSVKVVHDGAGSSWDVPAPGKAPGTYLYRVRGRDGGFDYGPYSNIEAVTVVPAPTAAFAAVVAQLNTPAKLSHYLLTEFQFTYHDGCVSYWPEQFYNRRKGDCKDYATFTSYVLGRHGHYSEIVSFRMQFEDGSRDGHVEVIYRDTDGQLRYMSNGNIMGPVASVSQMLAREAERMNVTITAHIVLPPGTVNVCSPD